MTLSLTEDIHSVTELKRHTREILNQARQSGRPVVLTVNGKADSVILDVKTYEEQLKAANLASLLLEAEGDIRLSKTRPMKKFLKEFKHAHKIQG